MGSRALEYKKNTIFYVFFKLNCFPNNRNRYCFGERRSRISYYVRRYFRSVFFFFLITSLGTCLRHKTKI